MNIASKSQLNTSGNMSSGSNCWLPLYCLTSASARAGPFAHDGIYVGGIGVDRVGRIFRQRFARYSTLGSNSTQAHLHSEEENIHDSSIKAENHAENSIETVTNFHTIICSLQLMSVAMRAVNAAPHARTIYRCQGS